MGDSVGHRKVFFCVPLPTSLSIQLWRREYKTSDFILIGKIHIVEGASSLSTRKRQCVSAVYELICSLPGLLPSPLVCSVLYRLSLLACLQLVNLLRPSIVSKNEEVDELFDCQHRRRIIECRMHAGNAAKPVLAPGTTD